MNRYASATRQRAVSPADVPLEDRKAASARVTVFRCVNSSRPGTGEWRDSQPSWPFPIHEVVIPCAGRLQPEHLLKAFEAGADAVCVVTCAGDECRYLEGSRRAERRADHVRKLLDEIGLGGHRLLVFHLDAAGQNGDKLRRAGNHGSPAAMRDMVAAGLALQPSPLRQEKAGV